MASLRIYTHRFTVRGAGRFPLDMLRYDSCFPVSQGDVCRLTAANRTPREVTLEHRGSLRTWQPEKDRWQSFGFDVIDVEKRE